MTQIMSYLKACIFDLDGVVVDTAKYHFLAWKRIANELGFDFSEQENELLKGVSRMRSLEVLLELAGKELSMAEKENLTAKKNDWYLEHVAKMQESEILPGVKTLLAELKRRGIKCAIGSASRNAKPILDRLNLTKHFDAISDGTLATNAKPDPEVFIKAAKMLGVSPAHCMVIEDSAAGVEAAKRAGMKCVGVGKPEVLGSADIVVGMIKEIDLEDVLS
jgi:beta-phosphoglucomutase